MSDQTDEGQRPAIVARWWGGKFQPCAAPDWWRAADERTRTKEGQAATWIDTFGQDGGYQVKVFTVPDPHGYLVRFDSVLTYYDVWAATEADLLDLLTTRVPAWINLPTDVTAVAALDRIANTLIGYARHGGGLHVSADGGKNRIDQRAEREEEKRMLAAFRVKPAPGASDGGAE